MMQKMRVFPLIIAVMGLLVGLKAYSFVLGVEEAFAEEEAPKAEQQTAENKSVEATDAEAGNVEPSVGGANSTTWSNSEIQILYSLKQRREEIDKQSKTLDLKEKSLQAVEKRINVKIASLKKIEEEIKSLLDRHDEREKAQIVKMVNIYSKMKAKNAAAIFNTLEMDVLIVIIEKMKESKVAPILDKMSPEKARILTVELATRKKLPPIQG